MKCSNCQLEFEVKHCLSSGREEVLKEVDYCPFCGHDFLKPEPTAEECQKAVQAAARLGFHGEQTA